MRIEEVIGRSISERRREIDRTQAEIGQELSRYLGRPWARQAVSAAERGERAFTAAELIGLAMVLGCQVETLLEPPPGVEHIELGEGAAPLEARLMRTTTGTNSDLSAVLDHLLDTREQMARTRAHAELLAHLLERTARVADRAARGRGIELYHDEEAVNRALAEAGKILVSDISAAGQSFKLSINVSPPKVDDEPHEPGTDQ